MSYFSCWSTTYKWLAYCRESPLIGYANGTELTKWSEMAQRRRIIQRICLSTRIHFLCFDVQMRQGLASPTKRFKYYAVLFNLDSLLHGWPLQEVCQYFQADGYWMQMELLSLIMNWTRLGTGASCFNSPLKARSKCRKRERDVTRAFKERPDSWGGNQKVNMGSPKACWL